MARYRTNMAELLKKVQEDGHEDVSSSKRMCQTIIEDATQIRTKLDSMSAEDKLDTWWTNKLAKSADNMNSARDYIMNPIEESLELDEGRMKTIYTMQQQGKSAAEIAKYMKLPVKTIKDILGEEKELEEKRGTITIDKITKPSVHKQITDVIRKMGNKAPKVTKTANGYVMAGDDKALVGVVDYLFDKELKNIINPKNPPFDIKMLKAQYEAVEEPMPKD